MKAYQRKKFSPVMLALQSQEEVDILFAVFNFYPLLQSIRTVVKDTNARFPNELLSDLHSPKYSKVHDAIDKGITQWYHDKYGRKP